MLFQDKVLDNSTGWKLWLEISHFADSSKLKWPDVIPVLHMLASRALRPSHKNPVQQVADACDGLWCIGQSLYLACLCWLYACKCRRLGSAVIVRSDVVSGLPSTHQAQVHMFAS